MNRLLVFERVILDLTSACACIIELGCNYAFSPSLHVSIFPLFLPGKGDAGEFYTLESLKPVCFLFALEPKLWYMLVCIAVDVSAN